MNITDAPTEDSIRRATMNSLTIASYEKMDTISFPALATGIGGFPIYDSAKIMLSAVVEFLQEYDYPAKVRFVLFDDQALETFKDCLRSLSHS